MICHVTKASDWGYDETIRINTLEELIEFMKNVDEEIVLEYKDEGEPEFDIIIYDWYLT